MPHCSKFLFTGRLSRSMAGGGDAKSRAESHDDLRCPEMLGTSRANGQPSCEVLPGDLTPGVQNEHTATCPKAGGGIAIGGSDAGETWSKRMPVASISETASGDADTRR